MREQRVKEYLQTIYALRMEGMVRAAYVAREMNLSKASVSNALKSLTSGGYLTIGDDHAIRLTPEGERLAGEAIRETIHRGKSYHGLLHRDGTAAEDPDTSEEPEAKWLHREGMESTLEALYVLGKHFYRVRKLDLAECLRISTGTVTRRLQRLEEKGFAAISEHGYLSLTSLGERYARESYDRHEVTRQKLVEAGLSERDAELSACLAQFK